MTARAEAERATPNGGTAWAAVALAPLLLLVVDPLGWYPFGPAKALVASVVVLAAAALGLAPGRAARPVLVAAGILVAAMALAAVVGRDPLYAWTGTPERHAGVALWALCATALAVGASVARRPVERGMVLAGLGVGLVGVAEAWGWEPEVLRAGDRLSGTFGSSAYLGAACALLLPLLVGLAVRPGRVPASFPSEDPTPTTQERGGGRAWRWAAAAAALTVVVPLVGSGARSAWIGVAAAGVVVLAARPVPHRAAVAGAGVVAVGLVLLLTPAGARLGSLADDDAPGGRGRLDEWRVAGRVVADHALTGVGPEGYRIAFGGAADADYEVAHGRDPLPDRAHSGPLDIALAAGLPGLAAWLAVWGLVLRRALPQLRAGPPGLAGAAAALVAHLVGQVTLFPLAELEPVAWLLAGVVVAAPLPGARTEPARTMPGTVRTAARAAAAVLALGAMVVGVRDVAADRAAERAADALTGDDGRAAVAAAEEAVALRPDEVRLHLLLARARLAADEGTLAALAAVDDAAALSPGDPIVRRAGLRLLVDRAAATQVPAHAATARTAVDEALADDPVSGELWLLAGEAATLDADAAAAERAWRRAERLTPGRPDAALGLALLHHAEGADEEAVAALDRARAIAPDAPRVAAVAAEVEGA